MLTLAEALVVVTAAGFLLGKKEIRAGSRFLGVGVGRVVGMLQGARLKYEHKTQGTHLYELHRNVKRGLEDMGTIGTDLASIRSGNVAGAQASRISTPESMHATSPSRLSVGMQVFENGLEIEKMQTLIAAEERAEQKGPPN